MENEMVIDPDDDRMDDGSSDDVGNIFVSGSEKPPEAQISISVKYLDLNKLDDEFTVGNLLYRLLHMLEVCSNKKSEIAHRIVEKFGDSNDTEFYRKYLQLIRNEPSFPTISDSVISQAETRANTLIELAQADLKRWQDSGVKESIRNATVNLFDAYFRSGRFSDATKLYAKSIRDFSSSPRAVIPMVLDQIKALMYMKDFGRIEVYLTQAERAIGDCQQRESIANMEQSRGASSMHPRDDKLQKATILLSQSASAKVAAVYGVIRMLHKQYKPAAEKFVHVDHEIFDYPEVLSPLDIAYYGCFCALATFDRQELLDKVLNNGNFRKFMEPEGRLVDLIQAFRNNSFVTVFELLEELRPHLLLNVYAAKHVENIYRLIRRRAFVQYTATFGVIDLPTMAKVFRTNTSELIEELVDLIDSDLLNARIDSISLKLYRPLENKIKKQTERIIKVESKMEHRINSILVRAALILNGVNVSREQSDDDPSVAFPPGAKKGRKNPPTFFDPDDYDDENFYPDDHDMISQTEQLILHSSQGSSSNTRGVLQRLMHRFGAGSRPHQVAPQPPPPVAGIGSSEERSPVEQGNGGPSQADEELEQTQSDVEMADP